MIKGIKNHAFTLMEMLVVIVIIGILLAIVIPSVSTIVNNRSNKLYQTHMQILEKASDLYVDKYKGELLSDDTSCFLINYNNLLNDNLIKEEDIKCEGYIILTKSENNKNLDSNYYLTCVDKDNKKLSNMGNVPNGCKGFNGKFKMEYFIYKDSEHTITYDGKEYLKDAYLVLNATSPYNVPISYYEYNLGLDGNWNKIDSNINLSTIDRLKNYVGNIYIRAVDEDMNTSTNISIPVKIDNKGPSFNVTVTGNYLEKEITISDVKDNGIGTLAENPYSFNGGNNWTNELSQKYIENTTTQVCVKDKLGNVGCREVKVTDIDRVKPTIVAISDKVYINKTDNKNISDFFNITYSPLGGSVKCTVDKTSDLEFGLNTVSCTATGTNTLTATASIIVAHQYNATAYCNNNRNLINGNCTYPYSNNESKCGCASYKSCTTSACGTTNKTCETSACGVASYKSCANEAACGCAQYRCSLYKKCITSTAKRNFSTQSSCLSFCQSKGKYSCRLETDKSYSCTYSYLQQNSSGTRSKACYDQFGSETVYGSECNNASSKTCVTASTCQAEVCGVDKYKSCQNAACGSYNNTCRTRECGCETANSCNAVENEYRYYQCESTGNTGTNGTLTGSLCKF